MTTKSFPVTPEAPKKSRNLTLPRTDAQTLKHLHNLLRKTCCFRSQKLPLVNSRRNYSNFWINISNPKTTIVHNLFPCESKTLLCATKTIIPLLNFQCDYVYVYIYIFHTNKPYFNQTSIVHLSWPLVTSNLIRILCLLLHWAVLSVFSVSTKFFIYLKAIYYLFNSEM